MKVQMETIDEKIARVVKEEIAVVNAALKAGVKEVDLYRLAMDNAAIQAVKMGEMHDNAAEKLQRWTAGFKDLKEAVAKWTIDTTMGFTPLEGLMMGSRSGSIDARRTRPPSA